MLARTMVVALVPGLVLAATVHLVSSGTTRRRLLHLAAGLGMAIVVAGSWYSATWRLVADYLLDYGYQADASAFGPGRPVLSLARWTFRLDRIIERDLGGPLTLAVLALATAAVAAALARRRQDKQPGPRWRHRISSNAATIAVFCGWCYLVLSSSRNGGLDFELPLVPAVVALLVAAAARAPRAARAAALGSCLLASIVAAAGSAGVLSGSEPRVHDVTLGPVRTPVLDSRTELDVYVEYSMGPCITVTCPTGRLRPTEADLMAWRAPAEEMAQLVEHEAFVRGHSPVVFFGVQDPLFNTNTVALAYQLAFAASCCSACSSRPTGPDSRSVTNSNYPATDSPTSSSSVRGRRIRPQRRSPSRPIRSRPAKWSLTTVSRRLQRFACRTAD